MDYEMKQIIKIANENPAKIEDQEVHRGKGHSFKQQKLPTGVFTI
ncbi:MAG: hypothetical protein ACOY35_07765 [Bacillota bacterium]